MIVTILGSGTSTGVPMVGCNCVVCSSTDPKDKRTRASILVEAEGHNIIVDTSTDLRKQAIRESIPKIDAVLFTHTHADHIHGIDDLRGFHFIHRRIIPCYGSERTISTLSRKFKYIFQGREEGGYSPLLEPHIVTSPFRLFGCRILPIPLIHGHGSATGYRFNDMAYLTDCSSIPDDSMRLLQGLDLLIIDALRHTPHSNHFNIATVLTIIETLRPNRTVLTHLSHEVPYSDSKKLPEGVELAYDGMRLDFT